MHFIYFCCQLAFFVLAMFDIGQCNWFASSKFIDETLHTVSP